MHRSIVTVASAATACLGAVVIAAGLAGTSSAQGPATPPAASASVAAAEQQVLAQDLSARPPQDSGAGAAASGKVPSSGASNTYRVESINIKSNPLMSADKVRDDVSRAMAQGSDVVMMQEIAPKYYKDIVKAVKAPAGKGTWGIAALSVEVPILYRTGGDSPWTYVNSGYTKTHGGLAKVSPSRYYSWVVLENKYNHSRTAFVNTHMVSGAWTPGHTAQQWRKDMWNKHFKAQAARMKAIADSGYSVVFGGDFNRNDFPDKFVWTQRWIAGNGIDKIGFIPAKTDGAVSIVTAKTVGGFHSDHDAKVVRFRVSLPNGVKGQLPPTTPTPVPAPTPGITAGGSTKGGAADPDTVQAPDGKFYTYSTKAGVPAGCAGAGKVYWVPVRVTAKPDLAGSCPVRDAMPAGPGKSWAYSGCKAAVWAPSVVNFGGRWILFYAASKAGRGASCDKRGQMCIGKAYASSPLGPFKDAGEVACPGKGRWALDPDAFVAGNKLYLVYRDDAVTTGADTGISGVELNSKGAAIWSTRHTLLTSKDITWETAGTSGGTHVIENPSMAYVSGKWRLFFSGNNWDSKRYAVGLATCGSAPVNNKCSVAGSTSRPWFGYTGAGGLNPLHGLPGNHPGPGGLSVFTTSSGAVGVVWHWYKGARPAIIGGLTAALTVR